MGLVYAPLPPRGAGVGQGPHRGGRPSTLGRLGARILISGQNFPTAAVFKRSPSPPFPLSRPSARARRPARVRRHPTGGSGEPPAMPCCSPRASSPQPGCLHPFTPLPYLGGALGPGCGTSGGRGGTGRAPPPLSPACGARHGGRPPWSSQGLSPSLPRGGGLRREESPPSFVAV